MLAIAGDLSILLGYRAKLAPASSKCDERRKRGTPVEAPDFSQGSGAFRRRETQPSEKMGFQPWVLPFLGGRPRRNQCIPDEAAV